VMAELAIPSFTIFWFGLAGLLVGIILFLVPAVGFTWQLFIWAMGSCVMTLLWFKFLKPLMADRTKAGISREAIVGESGQVIRAPADKQRGTVRFTTPILGAEEWPFICDGEVRVGDRVRVTDISGNTLIVAKR
jgi:membrane protein implicated in regulation of membrane protease activity